MKKTKRKLKKNWSHKAIVAKLREEFIAAGGYDGRYRPRVVESKKTYKRSRDKKVSKEVA